MRKGIRRVLRVGRGVARAPKKTFFLDYAWMKRLGGETKKIDGKIYTFDSLIFARADLNRRRKLLKEKGYSVRIVKPGAFEPYPAQSGWYIYRRK